MPPDQTVVSPPEYQLPSLPPNPRKGQTLKIVLIVIAILVVIIAAFVASYYLVPSVKNAADEAIAIQHVPTDLRSAVFQDTTPKAFVNYRIQGFEFAPIGSQIVAAAGATPDGTLGTYAQPKAMQARSLIHPSDSYVYLVRKGQQPTILSLGSGSGFLDDTHLLYFAPGGIVVRDVTSASAKIIYPYATSTTLGVLVRYSPDRTHILWMNASGDAILAQVSPTSYKQLHVFTGMQSAVLTNTSIYQVRALSTGTELWQYSFDGSGGHKVLTLPAALKIQSISI